MGRLVGSASLHMCLSIRKIKKKKRGAARNLSAAQTFVFQHFLPLKLRHNHPFPLKSTKFHYIGRGFRLFFLLQYFYCRVERNSMPSTARAWGRTK